MKTKINNVYKRDTIKTHEKKKKKKKKTQNKNEKIISYYQC